MVLWCFLSVGTVVVMDVLKLFQKRESCSNVTVKIVLQHSSSANSGPTMYVRLYSHFPALFLFYRFSHVPWRRNKLNCLDSTKGNKLFCPGLCLCSQCMCDTGK